MLTAIVLAAGTGSRLREVTSGPKCLLELRGRPLLAHLLAVLAAAGVDDVVAITGHGSRDVTAAFPRLSTREYAGYAGSNNLWTLARHRDLLRGRVLVSFADVLTTVAAVSALLRTPAEAALLVDRAARREGTMRVRMDGDAVVDAGAHIPPAAADGNFVGMARLQGRAPGLLAAELAAMGADERYRHDYYTRALLRLPERGVPLAGVDVCGQPWLEVDTPADLAAARAADHYLS